MFLTGTSSSKSTSKSAFAFKVVPSYQVEERVQSLVGILGGCPDNVHQRV